MDIANRIKLINIAKSHLDMVHGELEAARQMYEKMDRLLENAVEIGQIAALLEEKEKIEVEDGKELAMFCVDLAKRFEDVYDDDAPGSDYWGEIDKFASDALIEEFGKSPQIPDGETYFKSKDIYDMSYRQCCYKSSEGTPYSKTNLLALVSGDVSLCDELFENLEGEEPDHILDIFEERGEWTTCEECGRFIRCKDAATPEPGVIECPYCHAIFG